MLSKARLSKFAHVYDHLEQASSAHFSAVESLLVEVAITPL